MRRFFLSFLFSNPRLRTMQLLYIYIYVYIEPNPSLLKDDGEILDLINSL